MSPPPVFNKSPLWIEPARRAVSGHSPEPFARAFRGSDTGRGL